MNHQRAVQWAVMCLQELDAQAGQALSFLEISQRRGIPLQDCTRVIGQLSEAGIVALPSADRAVLCRAVEELTALDILKAVWEKAEHRPSFQALIGNPEAAQKTLEFVSLTEGNGAASMING